MSTIQELYNRKLKGESTKSYGTLLKDFYLLDNKPDSVLGRILSMNGSTYVLIPVNNEVVFDEYLKVLISIKEGNSKNILSILNQLRLVRDYKEFKLEDLKSKANKFYVYSDLINKVKEYGLDKLSKREEFQFILDGIGIDYYIELLYLINNKTELFQSY